MIKSIFTFFGLIAGAVIFMLCAGWLIPVNAFNAMFTNKSYNYRKAFRLWLSWAGISFGLFSVYVHYFHNGL